jgi:hypothetical protein
MSVACFPLPDPHLENEEQKANNIYKKKKEKWKMSQHNILQIMIEHIFHKFSFFFVQFNFAW